MEHYRWMAATLGPMAGTDGGREAIERLAAEWSNVEEVLEAGLTAETALAWIDAAVALTNFVRFSGLGTGAPLDTARGAARRSGDLGREANCIWSLGDIALQRSDHEAARPRFEEALLLYRRVGDVLGEAYCIQSLGNIALARSDHDDALSSLRRSPPALPKGRRRPRRGQLHQEPRQHRASPFGPRHRAQLASKKPSRSIERWAPSSARPTASGASATSRLTFGHDAACSCFEEALPLYRKIGSVKGEANCIRRLGDIALQRSDHDAARSRFEEALPLYRKVGSVLGEANCIKSLGDIALQRSDHDAARCRFEEALPLYRKMGAVLGEANCITCLGDIALGRSEHDAARIRFEEALPLFRKVGSVLGEAACIQGLGDIALGRSEHDGARSHFEEALTLYARIPAPYSMGQTERLLARLASTDAERRQRVETARRLWTGINRPDLVAQLDKEFPPSQTP